jgi:hypothetical protein
MNLLFVESKRKGGEHRNTSNTKENGGSKEREQERTRERENEIERERE